MIVDNEIELNIELDGQPVTVKLSELPVQMPVLSVRKIVKKGNKVVFQDQGGYIGNRNTGRNINSSTKMVSTLCDLNSQGIQLKVSNQTSRVSAGRDDDRHLLTLS